MTIKNEESSYYSVMKLKLKDGEEPLGRVVGHSKQKEELINIINWFNKSKELKEKGISIPRGILLYGRPGNGKSLLMKEIMKCVDAPCFVFKGDGENVAEEIEETFKKANETGRAVIIIDELDLLLDKDCRVTRILQDNLDGVESGDDILVIAATNNRIDIPEPLRRPGRLERIIHIPFPSGEEAVELLKMHFKKMNVSLPNDIDDGDLARTLEFVSGASIKSLANDVVLRNGFENITCEMIGKSLAIIEGRASHCNENDYYETAVHEAGHAVMANHFKEHYQLSRLNIGLMGGYLCCKETKENCWPYDKIIADIMICYAGLISEKVIIGVGDRGCEDDLQNARIDAYNAINMVGYKGCYRTLPEVQPHNNYRTESQKKKRNNEILIERLLKKCERKTTRFVKKHKKDIITLADKLYEKKFLTAKEVYETIN